ncbi:hypothetical protein [Paludisphaera soli]|uniref:hypothetical protein n=1 Tax=Paludisphaera soli TaxID=2712865 RepID=UPI0013ECAB0D|nr:hypothetical protein [Paludisphaera soli]
MIRTMKPTSIVSKAALLAILALVIPRAEAQVKPFKVTGGGIASYLPVVPDEPAHHFAVGQATELGRYFGEGSFALIQFTSPTTAEFSSSEPFVFIAANGDRLAFTYGDVDNGAAEPGNVTLTPQPDGRFVAVFVAEFNPIPEESTGRFARVVDGSFIMVATTEPFVLGDKDPVVYAWQGQGWLEYAKGKK